jgi:hypothetical protein
MPSCAGSKALPSSTLAAESFSITSVSGTRPPGPITVAGGNGAVPSFVTPRPGDASSVMVRLSKALLEGAQLGLQPARNSCTVPRTSTRSPTATALATDEPKTTIASEVAGFASGLGSCTQTLEPRLAITMPSTLTACPAYGERCVAPCTWPISVSGSSVVKVKL